MPLRSSASPGWLTDLQLWAVAGGASTWLIDLEPYAACRVVGVVERLRIDPIKSLIEARVTDGTGEVIARWFIRRPTPQLSVVPGRGVILQGVAVVGDEGDLVLDEPAFEIISFGQAA